MTSIKYKPSLSKIVAALLNGATVQRHPDGSVLVRYMSKPFEHAEAQIVEYFIKD